MSWLSNSNYNEGVWKGQSISELELAHLNNIRNMLEGYINSGYDKDLAEDAARKLPEIIQEMSTRRDQFIQKNEYRFLAVDLVEFAKQRGCKIPATGAGVYILVNGKERQIVDLYVRWDTTKKLAVAGRQGSDSKAKRRGRRKLRRDSVDRLRKGSVRPKNRRLKE